MFHHFEGAKHLHLQGMVGPEIDVKLLAILGYIPEEPESSTSMPRKSQFQIPHHAHTNL